MNKHSASVCPRCVTSACIERALPGFWHALLVFALGLLVAVSPVSASKAKLLPTESADDELVQFEEDELEEEEEEGEDEETNRQNQVSDGARPLVYLTREDRREAGLKRKIFPWLTVAGLLELEWVNERLVPLESGQQTRDQELGGAVQVAAEITPTEWSKLELIYEYSDDDDENRHALDEAILSLEYEDFEWEVGRMYPPFGEYFSHFVEGPVLEFAEIRATGANISYAPSEALDVTLFTYKGKANPAGRTSDEFDWGAAMEYGPASSVTLGLSYVSDLADAMDSVIDPEDLPYSKKVDALSGYAVFGFGDFEGNLEFVNALDNFPDLEGDRNRPEAWNAEMAYYPADQIEIAIRFEASREIEDAPKYRAGFGGAWWFSEHAVFRLEYLYGRYQRDLAQDDLEQTLDSEHLVAGQISVEF